MKTDEAFKDLISQKAFWKKCNILKSTGLSIKARYNNGDFISTDKKIELLIKAGYKIIQEMKWNR